MNKLLYFFLSLLVTFKSFPVLVFFCIEDEKGISFILNKSTERVDYMCVDLDEFELQNIDNKLKKGGTVIGWCREFSKKNINFLDKKKLEKVFNYVHASTVEFLQKVFSVYEVFIYLEDINGKRIQIDNINTFLNYISTRINLKLEGQYLYICFREGSVTANDLIGKNDQIIKLAIKKGNVIIEEIEAICEKYLNEINASNVEEKTSFNFDILLNKKIDNFFSVNHYNKNNLTNNSFVNESLKNKIEELKKKYVKICKNVIDKKKNELHKMKSDEKNKKTEIGLTNIGTTSSKTGATSSKTGGVNNNLITVPMCTTNKTKYTTTNNPKGTLNNFSASSKITTGHKTSSTITAPKSNITKINIPGEINTNINNTDTATTNHKNKTTTSTGAKPTTSTVADNINKTEVDNDLIKGSETSDGSTTTSKFGGGCCSSCRNNGN